MFFNIKNRSFSLEVGPRVSSSFVIRVKDKDILYTYIRKNACSSFKKFFAGESCYDLRAEGSVLKGMQTHHRLSKQVRSGHFDASIFVYRDPAERAISAFVNKLIQEAGAIDFTRSVSTVCNVEPGDLSFRKFVEFYLSRMTSENIDAHVVSQARHLIDVNYTNPIRMDELHSEMRLLLGTEIADKYFLRKSNSSGGRSTYIDGAWDMPVSELRAIYQADRMVPSKDSFLNERMRSRLFDVYSDDYRLIEELEA